MRGIARDALFAYGTLITGRAPEIVRRALARHAVRAEPGWIAARPVPTRAWYPAAMPDPTSRLCGIVFFLARPKALWPLLDRYEDAHRFGFPEFVRRRVTVHLARGGVMRAWAYLVRHSGKCVRSASSGSRP